MSKLKFVVKYSYDRYCNESYKKLCEQANILYNQNLYLKAQLTSFQLNIYQNHFNKRLLDKSELKIVDYDNKYTTSNKTS